jgi:mRNA-degrading endonuclease YafQ of YafQ-DinJ toxin-antitoxin module
MMEITFSTSFKRAYKKWIKGQPLLEKRFWERIEIFQRDAFDSRLKTHQLSGKLQELWSFSIDYNNRVVFTFIDKKKSKALFVDIGTHDAVY